MRQQHLHIVMGHKSLLWCTLPCCAVTCCAVPYCAVLCCAGDLDKDAFAPRLFVKNGLEVMVAQSYSKNLGLYGERVGALNVVLNDPNVSDPCTVLVCTYWGCATCCVTSRQAIVC